MADKQEKAQVRLTRLTGQANDPGFWREIWQQIRLVFYLLRDPDVPFYLKLLPFAGLLYVLFPFDLLADFAPMLGQLDDITAVLVSSKVFIDLSPPEVVARHMATIRQQDGLEDTPEEDGVVVVEGEHEPVE